MARLEIPLPTPSRGAILTQNPRTVPADGAVILKNFRVEDGVVRSRPGTVAHYATPNANTVLDIFNTQFNDKTIRVLRCTAATGTAGATSPLHYDSGSAWTALTLDNTFGGAAGTRFWVVPSPWAASITGRIILSNNLKIKQWDGVPANSVIDVAGGFPSKFGFVASDGRLIIANLVEGGSQQLQRVRGTVPFLPNGGALDWTDTGSFALDLREDSWAITGLFEMNGQIFVPKERSITVLVPTGSATSPYNTETVVKNGTGVFVPRSLVQFGNFVAFLGEDDVHAFDGINAPGIGAGVRRELFRRLNYSALDQVTAVVDAQSRRVGWGLPLDGASYPTEIWWIHMSDFHWEIDTRSHSAMSIYVAPPSRIYDDFPGLYVDYNAMAAAGTYDALVGPSALPKTQLLYGFTNGDTQRSDDTATTDAGGLITSDWISPAIRPVGEQVTINGQPHVITEDDKLILDMVEIQFIRRGDAVTVNVQATANNGYSWVSLGTIAISASVALSDSNPQILRQTIHTRFAIGSHVQIRLTNTTSGGKWGFLDAAVKIDVIGRKQA